MADPSTYRPAPGTIPTEPGVYRFRDKDGRVIYVGKARSLRSRLTSYFQDLSALHPRTQSMVLTGASVEWTVVANEVEALQLEYQWIKEFDPRFNVKYRDDKSYPYLAVTLGEEYPRAQVLREAKRKGTRYFGPYAHAWAIRETLDLLLRVFPVRTCSKGVFRRASQVGRPCLLGYIDKCSAPCVGRVSEQQHRILAEDLCSFLAGDSRRFIRRLESQMRTAAQELDFERAARLRDDVTALNTALERSAIVLPDGTDADVFGIAADELESAIQVFHVRGGRVRGQRGWIVENLDNEPAAIVEHLLLQVYGTERGDGVPREVLVPVEPSNRTDVQAWLTSHRGSNVEMRVPRRGDKRALMETVARNAEQSLARHKLSRAGDLTARSESLRQLQEVLDLPQAPLRIECYDISHVQGTNAVGSMVVFEDGLPRKGEYRRFTIRGSATATASDESSLPTSGESTGQTSDDTAAMHEVLTRRFRRLRDDSESTSERAPSSFSYPPNLVVVDGGLPQVNAAAAALTEVGVHDVPVIGLAKRLEEVWVPGEDYPVIFPRASQALYLLQRVRDEAHRFANTFHRQRRSTAMVRSELDSVPGLGPAKQRALLRHFGSVAKIRSASAAELQQAPGIGPNLATSIAEHLSATPDTAGINVTTGEVISG